MAWCESLAGHTETARKHAALGLRLSPRDLDLWLGVAYLNSFAPDFIPNVLRGEMVLYKMPEHNALLADRLKKAVSSA